MGLGAAVATGIGVDAGIDAGLAGAVIAAPELAGGIIGAGALDAAGAAIGTTVAGLGTDAILSAAPTAAGGIFGGGGGALVVWHQRGRARSVDRSALVVAGTSLPGRRRPQAIRQAAGLSGVASQRGQPPPVWPARAPLLRLLERRLAGGRG